MRNLTKDTLLHDDPNHKRHGRDKRAKALRDAVDFVAIPSPLRGGGKELTGIDFDADSAGYIIEFGDASQNTEAALGKAPIPPPQRVDAGSYRCRILKEEKERRRFRRTVTRNEKKIETWGSHKCGGVSLVVTVAPWTMSIINLLEDDIRDQLIMDTAHVAATRIKEISGRVCWGAGCHQDTDVLHWHFQIPKTSPVGDNWPKDKFKTGGAWLTGADRVERKFPGLLSPKQKEIMDGHKQKKGQLVDLEIASAVDAFLEKRFTEMNLAQEYEQSCQAYILRKKRAQETERHRALLRESLRHFGFSGVWPLAASAMRFAMWRLIPREYRKLVVASMRLTQIIDAPISRAEFVIGTQEILKKLAGLSELIMTGPGGSSHKI